jgi:pimeloyl-ACP methyl ester carboxylesterase
MAVASCAGNGDGGDGDDRSNVRERNVSFETSDELKLTGRLFGKGRVGVTLSHMFQGDATTWYSAARELARAGYLALAFDFRGYGDSEGEQQTIKTPADIESAAAYLKTQGARDVAFVGASMGGTASLLAAQSEEPLAVVAVSAPVRFRGLDTTIAATEIQRPVLLIASRGDSEAFEAVGEFERSLPNPEDTKIYDGDAHGTSLLDDRPEAIDEIIEFLKRYAPTSTTVTSPSS